MEMDGKMRKTSETTESVGNNGKHRKQRKMSENNRKRRKRRNWNWWKYGTWQAGDLQLGEKYVLHILLVFRYETNIFLGIAMLTIWFLGLSSALPSCESLSHTISYASGQNTSGNAWPTSQKQCKSRIQPGLTWRFQDGISTAMARGAATTSTWATWKGLEGQRVKTLWRHVVNARGTQTRTGICDRYGGVRVRIPIFVPLPNPYPCEGVCGYHQLLIKIKKLKNTMWQQQMTTK